MGRGLLQTSWERSEQERPEELLLPTAGAVVGLGGEMSRRCSCYRIVRLGYQLLVVKLSLSVVAEFLLSSREDDTRSWGNFLVYFSHKCHANLRGWGYIFIGC